MKVSELVDQLAVDLNDAAIGYEFTTWTKSQLKFYLREGMLIAFDNRPDLFGETQIIKVDPCSELQDTCDCTYILRVYGQSTKDGDIIKPLKQKKSVDEVKWTGRKCLSSPKYFELTHYYIDNTTKKLWLFPKVPGGLDIYVMIECAALPDLEGDFEVTEEVRVAVYQWALGRALEMDSENNPTVAQIATSHFTLCFNLLKAQKELHTVINQEIANEIRKQRGV